MESRRLLSVSLSDGVLTASGTAQNDSISALRQGTQCKINVNGSLYTFAASDAANPITSIIIDSGSGNDSVTISTALLANTTIDGQLGTDTLNVIGTTGNDSVSIGATSISLTESGISATIDDFENVRFDGRGTSFTGDVFAATGTSRVAIAGSQTFASVTLSDTAHVELEVGPASLVRTNTFTLNGSSTFNVNSNTLVIDYTGGTSPYPILLDAMQRGLTQLGGSGVSIGLSTEVINAMQATRLAIIDNATYGVVESIGNFSGIPLQSVIISYIWLGDTELNGVVDGTDYARTDSGLAGMSGGWMLGDFDLTEITDGTDYALIDSGFAMQSPIAIGIYNAAPMNPTVLPLWDGAARVAWNRAGYGVNGYIVWASIDGGDFVKVDETTSTHIDYRNFGDPATIKFRVAAVYNSVNTLAHDISISNPVLAINDDTHVDDNYFDNDDGEDHDDYDYPELDIAGPETPVLVSVLPHATVTNRIIVRWNDTSSDETGFVIQRSEDGVTFSDIGTRSEDFVAFTDNNATPGQTYWYRVFAINDNGFSAASASGSATAKLRTPTNLAASATNWQSINVTWTDNNTFESAYKLEVINVALGYDEFFDVPADATSYSVNGLKAGTEYTLKLFAVGSNNSATMTTAATTPAWGNGTPKAMEDFSIETYNGETVLFNWTDNATDESGYLVKYYEIKADGSHGPTLEATLGSSTGTGDTSDTLGGLVSETEYHFDVTPLGPNTGGGGGGGGGTPEADPENTHSASYMTTPHAGSVGIYDHYNHPGEVPEGVTVEWTQVQTTDENNNPISVNKTSGANETVTITFSGLKTHQYVNFYGIFHANSLYSTTHGTLEFKAGDTVIGFDNAPVAGQTGLMDSWNYSKFIKHTGSTLTLTITGTAFDPAKPWWIQSMMIATNMPSVSVSGGSNVTEGDGQKLQYTVSRSGPLSFPLDVEMDWFSNEDGVTQDDLEGTLPANISFAANEEFKIYEVDVKRDNKLEPEELLVSRVVAKEEYVPTGGPAFSAISDDLVRITGPDELWWFAGEDAINYAESGGFSYVADAPWNTENDVSWKITGNTDAVDISYQGGSAGDILNFTSPGGTMPPPVTMISTGKSDDLEDVTLELFLGGVLAAEKKITIKAPSSFRYGENPYTPYKDVPYGNGFQTSYVMGVQDQFGNLVPSPLEVNESFPGTVTNYTPNDWGGAAPPNWQMTSTPGHSWADSPSWFPDHYKFESSGTPTTVAPNATGAGTLVNSFLQQYRAGSQTPGKGILFSEHTLYWYRGYVRQGW